jgi:hypothetical protein
MDSVGLKTGGDKFGISVVDVVPGLFVVIVGAPNPFVGMVRVVPGPMRHFVDDSGFVNGHVAAHVGQDEPVGAGYALDAVPVIGESGTGAIKGVAAVPIDNGAPSRWVEARHDKVKCLPGAGRGFHQFGAIKNQRRCAAADCRRQDHERHPTRHVGQCATC